MKAIWRHCMSNEARWTPPDPEPLFWTKVSGKLRNVVEIWMGWVESQLLSDKWWAQSLSSALFWSQSHAPYMARAVDTIVLDFPVMAMAQSQAGTDITGLECIIHISVLLMLILKLAPRRHFTVWRLQRSPHLPKVVEPLELQSQKGP